MLWEIKTDSHWQACYSTCTVGVLLSLIHSTDAVWVIREMSELPPGNEDTKAVTAPGASVHAVFVSNKQQRSRFPFAQIRAVSPARSQWLPESVDVRVIRCAVKSLTSVPSLKGTKMSFKWSFLQKQNSLWYFDVGHVHLDQQGQRLLTQRWFVKENWVSAQTRATSSVQAANKEQRILKIQKVLTFVKLIHNIS